MWCDAEFPADDSSLYLDPMQRPDYATENIDWKRPHEIYTQEDGPMMMKDGFTPGDVK